MNPVVAAAAMFFVRRIFMKNNRGKNRPVDEDGFLTAGPCHLKPMKIICVSVKISDDKVQVRDTKDPSKTTLTFDHNEWKAFISGVKNGEFDV